MEQETINQRIKRILKEKNVSQSTLAKALGIHRASVSDRLNSDTQVDSFSFLFTVSKVTGLSISYLYFGNEFSDVESQQKSEALEIHDLRRQVKELRDTLDQIRALTNGSLT